jgi:sec-independent protein translocase protein TatC
MTNLLAFRGKERRTPEAMTLGQHLGELRRRLVVCLIAFVIAAIVAIVAYEPILHVLLRPLCAVTGSSGRATAGSRLVPAGSCNLYVTSPLDGLSLRVKITVFGGLIMSSPVILFQLWRFIVPGLHSNERKYALPFVSAAFGLFVAGAATAYFTIPHALGFLHSVGGPNLQAIYDPIPYLGLIILMMTLFGLTFQFPVILVSLQLARVVTPAKLLRSWRWAIIVITVVAAVVTPSSDPFSMFALALPLIFFYFVSIGVGKLLGR